MQPHVNVSAIHMINQGRLYHKLLVVTICSTTQANTSIHAVVPSKHTTEYPHAQLYHCTQSLRSLSL